jgi:hypothetical protein
MWQPPSGEPHDLVSYIKLVMPGRILPWRLSALRGSADLPTHEDVLAAHLDADPEYRREWEDTALARAVAVKVIAYRAEHRLSRKACGVAGGFAVVRFFAHVYMTRG